MPTTVPKLLVFSASLRDGSYNQQLAALAARRLQAMGAMVTELNLADYPLPLYNGNLEAGGVLPAEALALHAQLRQHDGVLIASPEYNASVPPLLVNALDWVSRVGSDGGMAAAFGRPVFALAAASPGGFGGYRGLVALRQLLELGLFARVLPGMVSVPVAHEAFDQAGELVNSKTSELLRQVLAGLIAATSQGRPA
ncbi:NAD(P)H-dependent FMN reductase [Duganella sp. SG902]|uniref:NADPH-dependent FMN reductase n=1 Tax=Duganella sp. SG902 TaxID=2587016 RepID=UPI00181C7F6F|nr:NAD(P)H-dependent oxidoreductase [Duganella sp. SG902]NVM77511.1 NAD(P)H-dependent FMN reductase [Duganella sp. SG902]